MATFHETYGASSWNELTTIEVETDRQQRHQLKNAPLRKALARASSSLERVAGPSLTP
jgi:hypothetical protein